MASLVWMSFIMAPGSADHGGTDLAAVALHGDQAGGAWPSLVLPCDALDVHYRWQNVGTTTIPGSSQIENVVFLSRDATITEADIRLGEQVHVFADAMPPGETRSGVVSALLPCDVAPGDYHVGIWVNQNGIFVDEVHGDNNILTAPFHIDGPDLEPLALDAPTVVSTGEPIGVSWTAHNSGTVVVFQSWTDEVGLFTSGGGRLGTLGATPTPSGVLLIGFAYSSQLQAHVPGVPSGHHVFRLALDQGNEVAETVEGNNQLDVAVEVRTPDLAASNLQALPVLVEGIPTEVRFDVTNQDDGVAWAPWTDAVYLSTDHQWDPSDLRLGSAARSTNLQPGETYEAVVPVTGPALPAGVYFLVAASDAEGSLYESDEEDNHLVIPVVVVGTGLPR